MSPLDSDRSLPKENSDNMSGARLVVGIFKWNSFGHSFRIHLFIMSFL